MASKISKQKTKAQLEEEYTAVATELVKLQDEYRAKLIDLSNQLKAINDKEKAEQAKQQEELK